MLLCLVPVVGRSRHPLVKPSEVVERSFPEATLLEKDDTFIVIVNNCPCESLDLVID